MFKICPHCGTVYGDWQHHAKNSTKRHVCDQMIEAVGVQRKKGEASQNTDREDITFHNSR